MRDCSSRISRPLICLRKQLQARNRRVERIYFPDSGVASVVANGDTPIEVGMIGREGMTGILTNAPSTRPTCRLAARGDV